MFFSLFLLNSFLGDLVLVVLSFPNVSLFFSSTCSSVNRLVTSISLSLKSNASLSSLLESQGLTLYNSSIGVGVSLVNYGNVSKYSVNYLRTLFFYKHEGYKHT